MVAMSAGATVIESQKTTDTITSRVGAAPSGKVLGVHITPAAPQAIDSRIEPHSLRPIDIHSVNGRDWEPSFKCAFNAALNAK
jgi:hypothetical protein